MLFGAGMGIGLLFCVIGLALAYFQYRKNKSAFISTIFIPLLGEDKANGPIGKIVDILATLTTIAGILFGFRYRNDLILIIVC